MDNRKEVLLAHNLI